MSHLSHVTNARSADLVGDLTETSEDTVLGSASPVLATPAVVAAGALGVAAAAGAGAAGYAAEEAADG